MEYLLAEAEVRLMRVSAIPLALIIAASTADADPWQDCVNNPNADAGIKACSVIIEAGAAAADRLAHAARDALRRLEQRGG